MKTRYKSDHFLLCDFMAEIQTTTDKYVCLQDLLSAILNVKRPMRALAKMAKGSHIGPALVMVNFPRMYKSHCAICNCV
jgi:hypothetical protein